MSRKTPVEFEYNLKRFDPSTMDKSRACVFIGGSGTGKSSLMTSILHANRAIPAGIVFSPTEAADPHFSKFIPDIFIYNDWEAEKLEDLMQMQMKAKKGVEAIDAEIDYCRKNGRNEDLRRAEAKKHARMQAMRKFVVLDDCAYKKGITRSETLRKLFMNGRHWGILTMFSVQYCVDLDISLRGNAGYVFVCRENIINYRKRIYDNFLGMLPSFQVFEKVMDACTQNYECLVLDRTQKSTRVEDCLFWYKANAHYDFRIGSEKLWTFHRRRYDKEHDDRRMSYEKAKREQGAVRKLR
jgi:hypothetical protein